MRKSRYSTEQIVGILKVQEAGAKISELCLWHGIADNTFHRGKRTYGGMEVSDTRRLSSLRKRTGS